MALSFGSTCSDKEDDGSSSVCDDDNCIDNEIEAAADQPLAREGTSSAVISSRQNQHRYEFPIESTLPGWCQKLRVWTSLPLKVVQQVLLLVATIQDFSSMAETSDKLVPIPDLDGTRRLAILVLFVTLLTDSLFLFAAMYYGGVNLPQIKQLWPIAGYQIGFGVLTGRISFGALQYIAGTAFVAFLSEFCVPLKLYVNYYFASSAVVKTKKDDMEHATTMNRSSSNISSSIWQLRLLFLEMYMLGACTFVGIAVYAFFLGDRDGLLSTKTKRNYIIVMSLAICYWILQLIGSSRVKMERLLHNLKQHHQGEQTPVELAICNNNDDKDDGDQSRNRSS